MALSTVSVVLGAVAALCALAYWWLRKAYTYWADRGVFFLAPHFLFGNVKDRILMRVPYHVFYKDLYFKMRGQPYGGFFEGRKPNLMVLDPELIKSVLVRDFDCFVDRLNPLFLTPDVNKMLIVLSGAEWKAIRAAMTPAFSTGKIRAMMDLVNTSGDNMSQYLHNILHDKGGGSGALEMKELLSKYTLDVIASCAFAVQCDAFAQTQSVFSKQIAKFNDIPLWQRMLIFAIIVVRPPLFITRFLPMSFLNRDTLDFLADIVKQTVSQRIKNNDRHNDFLQLLMDASTAEGDTEKPDSSKPSPSKKYGGVITEEVLVAQSVLFLMAGYDTSSSLLATTCYELAMQQDVQDRARAEIREVLAKHGSTLSYDTLAHFPYLDMVISEALRKYPPVARLDRVCTKECTLGQGLKVEAGTNVAISVVGLHYDPEHFPSPETFDPLRFSAEAKAARSPYVYLPFGTGPRNCIGMRFAQMSAKVCLVHLLKDFHLETCDKTDIPFKYHKRSMLLKAENGVWLNVHKL